MAALIEAAFRGKPYSQGNEVAIVTALRRVQAIALSLVAEIGGEVIGQVIFSHATCESGESNWFALGPVAVHPDEQHNGIGAQLIRSGLMLLNERGAAGCILVGSPRYYARFGFEAAPIVAPPTEPAEYFMVKRLSAKRLPAKAFAFHPAFYTET